MDDLKDISIEKLRVGDDAEWRRLWPPLLHALDDYVRVSLLTTPKFVQGHVDDIKSTVTLKLYEKLAMGQLNDCRDVIRYACSICKNDIKKAKEGRFDSEPALIRRGKKARNLHSQLTDTSETQSQIVNNREVRNSIRRALKCLRKELAESLSRKRMADSESVILQYLFLDSMCHGKCEYGDVSGFVGSIYPAHTQSRIKSNALSKLFAYLQPLAGSSAGQGCLTSEDLRPGEVISNMWHENSHGCANFMSFRSHIHESNKKDFDLYTQAHLELCLCDRCNPESVSFESERVDAWSAALRESIISSTL
jgi:hypothetical protein